MIDIVVPLYNEARILAKSVETIIDFLNRTAFPYSYAIILADNASTDGSGEICDQLEHKFPGRVKAFHLDSKGKGLAVRKAWERSDAEIVAFMDADLSSDLDYLSPLIEAVWTGGADLSIGNRLGVHSRVISRKMFRKAASYLYNFSARVILGTPFDDHQCGFKAMKRSAFATVAPLLEEKGFFFDTELLAISVRRGFKVKSIDIIWRDSDESKVSLFSDSIKMFADLVRLRRRLFKTEAQTHSTAPSDGVSIKSPLI